MTVLVQQAISEERYTNAAQNYRTAEFFTNRTDPDDELLYDKFIAHFDLAFGDDGFERFEVPYRGSHLPAMCLADQHDVPFQSL